EVGQHMLYTTNKDIPGIIGKLGTLLGDNKVNVANFTLGRSAAGGEAIAIAYLDAPAAIGVVTQLEATGLFQQVKPLEFNVV
ncbi:MAG TPA: phosphoglycerate dehydrogenase, partial [Paenirhodobacter sp.]